MLVRAAPVVILAVHDAGLLLVELKPAFRQPHSDHGPQLQGLSLASSMDNNVIAVALERDRRERPGHPRIERVMQHHVGEQRGDRRPLRGSAIPLDQAAIRHLQRRF